MRDVRVLVIGGGFAGIASASRLRALGARVMLLDDRASLGGRARSDVLDGWHIDVGAQLIATSYERTIALLGDSRRERAPALRRMPGRDVYLRDGAAYPINFGSLRSLLSFGAISAADKVRLGMSLVPLLARHRAALRVDADRVPAALDAESAGAFMTRAVSATAASALVDPVSATFCGARADDVSLAFYLTLGRYGSEGDVMAPNRGWTAMLEAVLLDVEIARSTRVTRITHDVTGITVTADDGRSWDADGVVVATDAHAAATLLDPLAPRGLTEWLRSVRYQPSFTVAAAVDGPMPRHAFGILVHNDGRRSVSALAVHGAKAPPEQQPTGDVVLAWPTPDAAERLVHEPAPAIAAAIVPDIEALLPRASGRIGHVRVYRHERGTALPSPGFTSDRAMGRSLASRLELPITLAGDYLTMPLLEGAVASGEAAATALAAKILLEGRARVRPEG